MQCAEEQLSHPHTSPNLYRFLLVAMNSIKLAPDVVKKFESDQKRLKKNQKISKKIKIDRKRSKMFKNVRDQKRGNTLTF